MTYEFIRIVCLANSRKLGGRCIAGRKVIGETYGEWIRPVSTRSDHEISKCDRRYENGKLATVLEIFDIPITQTAPVAPQVENAIIDSEVFWERVGKINWSDLEELIEAQNGPLWMNGDSTYHGLNDKILLSDAVKLGSSLQLVRPDSLKIIVRHESGFNKPGKRRVRAYFNIAGYNYLLQVTDPVVEDEYLTKENGTYPIEESILCLSLSEPFNEYVFKLVAAVFTPDRCV